jgi:restriction system protein
MRGYKTLADFHHGKYDCHFVSPWSKSAHNVAAKVMVVGHDWSSEKWMSGPVDEESAKLGYSSRFVTNKNLFGLLNRHFRLAFKDVYATNAFPFIKGGRSQGSIRSKDMRWAVREFLLPQIKIIKPRLVLCLGLAVYDAIRASSELRPVRRLADAINSPFKLDGCHVVAVAHTGARGMNSRGRKRVEKDWKALGKSLQAGARRKKRGGR